MLKTKIKHYTSISRIKCLKSYSTKYAICKLMTVLVLCPIFTSVFHGIFDIFLLIFFKEYQIIPFFYLLLSLSCIFNRNWQKISLYHWEFWHFLKVFYKYPNFLQYCGITHQWVMPVKDQWFIPINTVDNESILLKVNDLALLKDQWFKSVIQPWSTDQYWIVSGRSLIESC